MDAPNPYQGLHTVPGLPVVFSPDWTDSDAEQIADTILSLIKQDWTAAKDARVHFEPNLRGYVRDNIPGISDNALTNMYQRVRRRWQNQFKKPRNSNVRVGGGPMFPPAMSFPSSPGFPPQHSPIARPPAAAIHRPVNPRPGPPAPASSLQQELLREETRKRKAAEDAAAMENAPPAKRATPVSPEDALITSNDPLHPANHIPTLCHQFYGHGWVTGTGGGISIKRDNHVFLAPSGVQKELMKPADIFVMDYQSKEYLRRPQVLKPSACTPLFMSAYTNRGAGACIHTHSQWAVLVTLICESGLQTYEDSSNVFCMREIEQIKGISRGGTGSQEIAEGGRKLGNLGYFDTMKIPIIENTAHEEDLEDSMSRAMELWPETCAVLVRRHGVYVWGKDVAQAKTQCESLDYLFQLAVEMHKLGLKWV